MRTKHDQRNRISSCYFVLLTALASFQVGAQALPNAIQWPATVSGSVSTLGTATTSSANAANFTFAAAANDVRVTGSAGSASLPLANGTSAPLAVVSKVSKADAAAAVVKFLGKATGVLLVGVALYDLMKDLGYEVTTGTNGIPRVQKREIAGGVTCVDASTCLEWSAGYVGASWVASISAAGADYVANLQKNYDSKTYKLSFAGADASKKIVYWTFVDSGLVIYGFPPTEGAGSASVVSRVRPRTPADTEVVRDVGLPEVDFTIRNVPAIPASLPRTLKDAAAADVPIPLVPVSVTGPSTVVGPSSTSVNAPKNQTTTKSSDTTLTYSGPSVTQKQVDKTKTVDSTTGAVVDESTTTTTPNAPPTTTTSTPSAASDTPTPDPCDAHPTRMGCSEFGNPEAPVLVKDTHDVTVTAVPFTSMAGCVPPLHFSVLSHQYMVSYQPLCDLMLYIKFIVLASCSFIAVYVLADSFRVT